MFKSIVISSYSKHIFGQAETQKNWTRLATCPVNFRNLFKNLLPVLKSMFIYLGENAEDPLTWKADFFLEVFYSFLFQKYLEVQSVLGHQCVMDC